MSSGIDASSTVRRLGLIGAESTGKTALARALQSDLGGALADEVLREFVMQNARPPRQHEQRAIMLAQQAREDDLALPSTGVVIGDPAALMTAVYSVAYFDDHSLLDEAIGLAQGYDLIAWCDTDVPWEADGGQRDGPAMRARVDDLLEEIVRLRLPHRPVVRASGSVQERVRAVRRAWQQQAPSGPT